MDDLLHYQLLKDLAGKFYGNNTYSKIKFCYIYLVQWNLIVNID